MNSIETKRDSGMSPAAVATFLIALCLIPAWGLAFDPFDAGSDFAIERVAAGAGAFGRLLASFWMFPVLLVCIGLQARYSNVKYFGVRLRHASIALAIAVLAGMAVRAAAFDGPKLQTRAKELTEIRLQYEYLVARNHMYADFLQEKIASGDPSVEDLQTLKRIVMSELAPAPKWATSNGK